MPFPPFPSLPSPVTYSGVQQVSAPVLRSDVVNALLLLSQPPMLAAQQTGTPAAFTAATTGSLFTAPGVSWTAGTPVVLSGASLPGGFAAGTVYFVISPSGDTFQLASTLGGSAITVTASGSGTVQSTQQIGSGAWSTVNMDTQLTDVWAGHLLDSSPDRYYGMFAGYYLAEFTGALACDNGAGALSAGITAQQADAAAATWGGQSLRVSATAGAYAQATAAKLLQFTQAGTWGQGNWASGSLWQETGSDQIPVAGTGRAPALQVEWVSALAGDASLPVPDNDAWPAPPAYPTSTFANKNIRDTIGFLIYPPVFEAAYSAGTATLASQPSLPSAGAAVPLDTVNADTRSAWQPGAYQWRAPVPGVYDLYGQTATAAASSSLACAAGLTITSSLYNGGAAYTIWGGAQAALTSSSDVNCAVVRRRLRLNAGDTVALAGFQDDSSSAAATLTGGTWQSRLIAIWRAQ